MTAQASPRYAIIEAPSVLGHIPAHLGVARMPDVLLDAGLAERLDARRAERVESPPYLPDRDPTTQVMNPLAPREFSSRLADAVEGVLDLGERPLVLGGDCSILLGTALALRRRSFETTTWWSLPIETPRLSFATGASLCRPISWRWIETSFDGSESGPRWMRPSDI